MAFAHMFPADYRAHGYAEARRVWRRLEGTSDWRRLHDLARLLVSVREGALVGVDWGRGPDGSVTFVYRSGEWYLVNNPEEAS